MAGEADPQNDKAKNSAGQGSGDNGGDSQEGNPAAKKGDSGTSQQTGDGGSIDESGWDEGTKKYIQGLRRENAKHRNDLKGVKERLTKFETVMKGLQGDGEGEEGGELDPEIVVHGLSAQLQQKETETAYLREAMNRGLTDRHAQLAAMAFNEGLEGLGEEPDEEALGQLWEESWEEAGRFSYAPKGAGKGSSTSVQNDSKGKDGGNSGSGDALTAEQFSKMKYSQKVELRAKNPEVYQRLFKEAVSKKLPL
jgi:hypothetical protein